MTKSAKEAFAAAFDGLGGATRLQAWAQEHETEFYKLFARLIPTEIAGDAEHPVQHVHRVMRWGGEEIPL